MREEEEEQRMFRFMDGYSVKEGEFVLNPPLFIVTSAPLEMDSAPNDVLQNSVIKTFTTALLESIETSDASHEQS